MKRNLKSLLSENFRSLLSEESKVKEEPGDSLDSQVDKFLIDYESEAKRAKNEGLDFRMMVRHLLREEDEEAADDSKDAEDEVSSASSPDDIDMGSYVASVMRLVDNYDNLLEVRNTILRRAKNYIAKNYQKEALEIFDDNLRETYGMEVGETKSEKQDRFQPPKAGAAGPAGGGGA